MYLSAAQALPPLPLPSCWLLDSLREWEANRAKAEQFFKNSSKPRLFLQHKIPCEYNVYTYSALTFDFSG